MQQILTRGTHVSRQIRMMMLNEDDFMYLPLTIFIIF
jgi:hypothetical protein